MMFNGLVVNVGAELHGGDASYECRCQQGWVGLNCEKMSPEAEGLEALRSLIGGTYKDGALDRMWGKPEKRGQQSLQTPLMAAATVGWVCRHRLLLVPYEFMPRCGRVCDTAPWSAGGRCGGHAVSRCQW